MLLYFRRMPDIDITPLLPRITAPTLALTGDADPIVRPRRRA
jgi:pimeloyl-ACP methyl ester carboxylesterase